MAVPPKPAPAPEAAPDAPVSTATVTTTTTTSGGQANWLDTFLVLGSLAIVAGVLFGLFVQQIPQANLPIIASLAGILVGTILGGYAGYRWGASDALKRVTAATTSGQ